MTFWLSLGRKVKIGSFGNRQGRELLGFFWQLAETWEKRGYFGS